MAWLGGTVQKSLGKGGFAVMESHFTGLGYVGSGSSVQFMI